jgi:hypothetical protein
MEFPSVLKEFNDLQLVLWIFSRIYIRVKIDTARNTDEKK